MLLKRRDRTVVVQQLTNRSLGCPHFGSMSRWPCVSKRVLLTCVLKGSTHRRKGATNLLPPVLLGKDSAVGAEAEPGEMWAVTAPISRLGRHVVMLLNESKTPDRGSTKGCGCAAPNFTLPSFLLCASCTSRHVSGFSLKGPRWDFRYFLRVKQILGRCKTKQELIDGCRNSNDVRFLLLPVKGKGRLGKAQIQERDWGAWGASGAGFTRLSSSPSMHRRFSDVLLFLTWSFSLLSVHSAQGASELRTLQTGLGDFHLDKPWVKKAIEKS